MNSEIDDLVRQAIQLLDEALGRQPGEVNEEVDEVERTVVAIRDNLIERMRQAETPLPSDAPARLALDRTNVALSLVVGIEYPVGGLQRGLIGQARETLAGLLEGV